MENRQPPASYSAAGVDLEAGALANRLIHEQAQTTFSPGVLGDVGSFGSLFQVQGYREPVLVSSVDGVGTKLKVAIALDKHDTVGIDLVNHCVNDILTCGAQPLFFLDYIAMGKLVPERIQAIATGLARACREAGCSLIGGETAEMPSLYAGGDYDLVGFIVGVVEKPNIIDGRAIRPGDVLLGLPSSGLHTNGYSLVRRIFGTEPSALKAFYPELGRTLGEELLEPHRSYYPLLKPALPRVKGLAHITGGGIVDNLPRILPQGLSARVDTSSWETPAIFRLIQERGGVDTREMYRVFNMGIGMIVVSSPEEAAGLRALLPQASPVGEVVEGKGKPGVELVGV
ncbi:MAG TPA: phosphoribosylformylglycinamidine cyclo-ligase [Dehalococcoidia bacterium]|nr:phosphoribosylformylglycinamidine cyclo-ligase [Dehalococcoidia bacterium]